MAEENKMTEENKKTIISFIAGLLIGGLLVFIFIEPATDKMIGDDSNNGTKTDVSSEDEEDVNTDDVAVVTEEDSDPTPVVTKDGAIDVDDQSAGSTVTFDSVEFPANTGWIGVRDYVSGQMTGLLGVSRFDVDAGLLPNSVHLLRPTVAGDTYAVVFYSDNGDRQFSLATDTQLAGVMETFKAK